MGWDGGERRKEVMSQLSNESDFDFATFGCLFALCGIQYIDILYDICAFIFANTHKHAGVHACIHT